MTLDTRRRVILGLCAAVFAVGTAAVFSYPAHHDLTWFLYVGGELLDGADLYTDIVEVNPPMILWISAIAELLARLTGVWNLSIYRLLTLCLAAGSILLCRRQLRRFAAPDESAIDLLTLLLAYAFVAGVGFEFGQREHLAIMLAFPFLLLTGRQLSGPATARAEDAIAGVLAGIGFAIKPHFLIAWLALQLYALLRRPHVLRSRSNIAALVTFAAYGIVVVLVEPDYIALARMGAEAYARMWRTSPAALLLLPAALISIAGITAGFIVPARTAFREVLRVLALAAAGFLCAVLVQAKGWTYHWIPSVIVAAVLLTLAAWTWLRTLLPRARSAPAATALAVIAAAVLLVLCVRRFDDADWYRMRMPHLAFQLPQMMALMEQHAGGGPIAALSTNMQVAFPLVNYMDLKWGLRFNSLWLLPGSYPEYVPGSRVVYHELDRMPAAERFTFDAVIHDLVSDPPTVLIVDRLPPGYVLVGFDYLTYFGRDDRFIELMRSYHELQPIERYRIFVRS